MDHSIKQILWRQFGASIDMLENVISNSPDDYFFTNKRFYYILYHTTVFLDYYLTVPPTNFAPLLPFSITEAALRPAEAIDELIPDKFYTKPELLDYIKASREKTKKLIGSLTAAVDTQRFTEDNPTDAMDYPILEILLYNMRHIQHHIGQLNLMIRLDLHQHMEWVFQTSENL
jgi:DinB superfamily